MDRLSRLATSRMVTGILFALQNVLGTVPIIALSGADVNSTSLTKFGAVPLCPLNPITIETVLFVTLRR